MTVREEETGVVLVLTPDRRAEIMKDLLKWARVVGEEVPYAGSTGYRVPLPLCTFTIADNDEIPMLEIGGNFLDGNLMDVVDHPDYKKGESATNLRIDTGMIGAYVPHALSGLRMRYSASAKHGLDAVIVEGVDWNPLSSQAGNMRATLRVGDPISDHLPATASDRNTLDLLLQVAHRDCVKVYDASPEVHKRYRASESR